MLVNFTKMHGIGNDMVIIDCINQNIFLSEKQIQRLADRNMGIGFDQLLLVEPPMSPDVDFHYRAFNGTGKEVQQCGNGTRCFARFVRYAGLTWKNKIRVSSMAGNMEFFVERNGIVKVNMGEPRFQPAAIPFVADAEAQSYALEVNEQVLQVGAVSMGNPHVALQVDDIDTADVAGLGPLIEQHERFPEGVNVGFMQVLQQDHIKLRVFERGTGETLACGSGACAAVVVGRSQGLLAEKVRVDLPGGWLTIKWNGPGDSVLMSGPATIVYDGQIELD